MIQKKYQYLRISNEILVGNLIANFLGNLITDIIFKFNTRGQPEGSLKIFKHLDFAIFIIFVVAGCSILILYERPIRKCLKKILNNETPDPELFKIAQRRILNEPYFVVLFNFIIWSTGSLAFWYAGSPGAPFLGIACGIITIILSFFYVEHVIQHNWVSYFFPDGGLSSVKGALRIKISTRLFMLILAGSVAPLLFIHINIVESRAYLDNKVIPLHQILKQLQTTIAVETILFMSMAIAITFLIIQNIKIPLKEILTVLTQVRKGIFTSKATVYSNDEIGFAGDVLNAMTTELLEKEEMSRSLNLAKEVQQNLLPQQNMKVKDIEIAGKSIYCDQTGGDYYDFIVSEDPSDPKISVVVADVSGHGISSALLMASIRSTLRLRKKLGGTSRRLICDVNRQISEDFGESGNFISLFYLAVNPDDKTLEWVRAGHDPGFLYDPDTGNITELKGDGLVLGLDPDFEYPVNRKSGLKENQLILLFTDGVWEAHNEKGESFGKNRLKQSIQQVADQSCETIIDHIIHDIMQFSEANQVEDDLTLVAIRFNPTPQ